MCSQLTQRVIALVVEDFTNEDKSFSAYDVSQKVQEDLKATNSFVFSEHRHNSIKRDVHRECEVYVDAGLYDRKVEDVGYGNRAFVYSPEGQSPSNTQTVNVPTITSDVRDTDARGTFCVPNYVVRSLNVVPFSSISVWIENGELVLGSSVPSNQTEVGHYSVDAYYNIRITNRFLSQISGTQYSVTVNGSNIVVKGH